MHVKIQFNYRNTKGQVQTRTVSPIRTYFGSTEYHTDKYLMVAYDHDKCAERTFCLTDIYGIAELWTT